MKFAIVTLFTLALALGVQSSVIPWGGVVSQVAGGHLAHTSVISPLGLPLGAIAVGHGPAVVPAAVAVHSPGSVAVHAPVAVPAAVSAAVHASVVAPHAVSAAVHAPVVAPAAISAAVHAPVVAPAAISAAVHVPAPVHVPAVVAGPGSYVAKTRGAIHTAPLAGHLNSVANVNVAPAPGTH